MSTIKEQLAKLLKIKSLVTLGITFTFIVLSLEGVIEADQFMIIFTTIIAFYFGTQTNKTNN